MTMYLGKRIEDSEVLTFSNIIFINFEEVYISDIR